MLRKLTFEELDHVSGGVDEIVVVGAGTTTSTFGTTFDYSSSASFNNSNYGTGLGAQLTQGVQVAAAQGDPDVFGDENGDADGDGIPNGSDDFHDIPIVWTGDRSVPQGYTVVPGGHYMYFRNADGTLGPLQFTPWYARQICEIYNAHQDAIDDTSSMYGYLATGIGVLNAAGGAAATGMGLIAEGTGLAGPPPGCDP